jgi:hypothetical protein
MEELFLQMENHYQLMKRENPQVQVEFLYLLHLQVNNLDIQMVNYNLVLMENLLPLMALKSKQILILENHWGQMDKN